MPEEHARLSPSGAHRWMRCPASLYECEKEKTERTSSYAEEGIAAHELMERTFASSGRQTFFFENKTASNGWVFDEEMCGYIQDFVDNIQRRKALCGGHLYVENRVDFSEDIDVPGSFGTADIIIINDAFTEIQIHDLKYGKGVRVSAERNEQMMLYALGAIRAYNFFGKIERVELCIHQPRLDHIDQWSCSVTALNQFAEEARTAAELAIMYADSQGRDSWSNRVYDPGDKQCRFCNGKATCPAIAEKVAEVIGVEFSDLTNDDETPVREALASVKEEIDGEKLGRFLEKADLIEKWIKAVRARVEAMLFDGQSIPGFKIVEGKRGNRQWRCPEEAEELLKSMRIKRDDMYAYKLLSPTQAEKTLKTASPRRWKRIEELIVRPEGKPSVAPESDKRPALNLDVEFNDLTDPRALI